MLQVLKNELFSKVIVADNWQWFETTAFKYT